MKTYQEIKFNKLPKSCRIWVKPKTGRYKEYYCFGVKTGDEVRIEQTNQIVYPRSNQTVLIENIVEVSNFPIIKTNPETVTIMATKKKAAKKTAKKTTKKAAVKKSAGRKPNAESVASKIVALHVKGKTNAEIVEALASDKVTNKYVCDVTWRHNNPKKGKK
jgi:hypothetical protein